VALGHIAPDIAIANGTVFNVFTREFIKNQSIWIKDGMIAYVGPDHNFPKEEKTLMIDADRIVLLPSLIKGHKMSIYNPSHLINFNALISLFRTCRVEPLSIISRG